MKRCSTSLVTREIKPTMKYYLTPPGTVTLNSWCSEDVEKLERLCMADGNVKWYRYYRKQFDLKKLHIVIMGLPWWLRCKESPGCRRLGSIPGLGRSPGGGHGNVLQYSCLENPHGQRSLQAVIHGLAESWTQLSN